MTRKGLCLICVALVLYVSASTVLGGGMTPEEIREFERLIVSNEASERVQAVSLLAKADDAKAFKLLTKIFERERDDTVIEAAFNVLKGFTDPKVISAVCKAVKKCQINEQRVVYVKALWEYDNEEAFKTILSLATDPAWQVRMTVADCLGDTAKKKSFAKAKVAIDLLLKWLFKEPDGRTQNHVRAALYYLTGKDYGLDRAKWHEWWSHEKANYGKPKVDEEGKVVDKDGDGRPDMTTELPKEKWREPVAEDDGSSRPKFFGHELKNARVIFVIDRTGSMNEASSGGKTKLQVLKDELVKTISAFTERYWFNMYFYSVGCFVWKPKLQKATKPVRDQAIQFVKNLTGAGMTDIGGALRKASQDPDADTIILLTDGKPTAGITDTEALLKDVRSWNKFKKIKINTVGMSGCDPNFLQQLAQQNGGAFRNAQ